MASARKVYQYSVEFNVQTVDAPGTRLTSKGDIYINICLLGMHRRTRLMPPYLPMTIDQKVYFDKIFKTCYEPRDIIRRLEREHVLIELLQSDVSSPIVLASYETSAKDFLYPYSSDRVQYTGLQRNLLLNRTIHFPGASPSLQFSISPSVTEVTGIASANKNRKKTKPIDSYGKNPKRSRPPAWKPSSTYPNRSSWNNSSSSNVSRSLTSHTISSAVKNDYARLQTQEKLRELAIPGEVKYVVPIDKTLGRQPFVVRHVNNDLIGRSPISHIVLNDGLVVNDYSLSRAESSMSLNSLDGGLNRSRSVSPFNNRNYGSTGTRVRSASPSRRSIRTSQSVDFERQPRSRTPQQHFNQHSTTRFSNDYDDHNQDGEFHSTKDCEICRLHHIHSEQSRRAKSLEQRQFTTTSKHKLYSPDIYSSSPSRYTTSATLTRDPFRYRHQQSPAGDLSDKVIHTLRHNLESYGAQPWHNYYSSFRYSDGHTDGNEPYERTRQFT